MNSKAKYAIVHFPGQQREHVIATASTYSAAINKMTRYARMYDDEPLDVMLVQADGSLTTEM